MLPFTREQFFAVFLEYNNAVWPASIVAYGLGILALVAVLRPKPVWSRVAAAILAVMWAWTGIAYQGIFFSAINGAAILFAALFIAQALALAYFGFTKNHLAFGEVHWPRAIIGWVFIAYAGVAYPLIGLSTGHSYQELPQFGITPCPVTLFTFGMLLLAKPPWIPFVIPVVWSLIGGSAALLLSVPQDWLLLASGVITITLLISLKPKPGHSAANEH
jgi:Family of unknown function (DUF6064)